MASCLIGVAKLKANRGVPMARVKSIGIRETLTGLIIARTGRQRRRMGVLTDHGCAKLTFNPPGLTDCNGSSLCENVKMVA